MKTNTDSLSLNKTTKPMFLRIAAFAILVAVASVWGFSQDSDCTGRDLTFKTFKGTVTDVDLDKGTVTLIKSKSNSDKTMTFDVCEGGVERGDARVMLSDVKVGDRVRAYYSTNNGVHTARRLGLRS